MEEDMMDGRGNKEHRSRHEIIIVTAFETKE